MKRAAQTLIFVLAATTLLTACGKSDSLNQQQTATLMLDFTPNAVHTGIYAAINSNLYRDHGIKLKLREPSSSSDPIKLLQTGKTDFALLDIHDLGIARQKGADLVGVMAVVEKPLAAVLVSKSSGVTKPQQLEGKRVGVTGVPSDDAVLKSIVLGGGGNPAKVRKVTIGFNAVASLIAGKVAGATAFWNAEGVALKQKDQPVTEFRVDQYGAPSYPELVMVATGKTLKKRPQLVRSVVRATTAGYKMALSSPSISLQGLTSKVKGLNKPLMKAQLKALLPAFKDSAPKFGYLDPKVLKAWGRWDVRFGILKKQPDISRAFTNKYL